MRGDEMVDTGMVLLCFSNTSRLIYVHVPWIEAA
jgi:hypothetical protein